jgi:hypothetical protein
MARVIEVRTEEKTRADTALAELRRYLHTAQKEAERAKVEAADAATEAGTLQDEGKALKTALCNAPLRAEQERLAADLEDNQRAQRLANHALVAAQDAQNEAEQREADLAAAVEAAQHNADEANASWEEAGKQEEQFTSWRTALAGQATTDAIADAATTQQSADYTKARDRLSRLLGGNDMLDVYRQRAWFAAENAAQAPNLLLDALKAAGEAHKAGAPLKGARLVAVAELGMWIDCLHDAAESTVTRLQTAQKTFKEQAVRPTDVEAVEPLKSDLARISARAQLVRDAGAAAKEKAWFDAERTVHLAEQALAAATVAEVADDPDTSPEQSGGLADEREAVEHAREAADTALAEYEAAKRPLDDYEVAIPEDLLADVMAFFDADMAIDKAKGVDQADLVESFQEAEEVYAAAEQAEVREARAAAMADAQVESRRRRQTASAGAGAAHKLVTIRGDR